MVLWDRLCPSGGGYTQECQLPTILSSEHMDCITPPSSESFEPSPTSCSSILITATLQSINFKSPIEELKSTLASDPTWHEALKQESKDSQRHYKNWSTLDDLILFRDWIYIPPSLHSRILFEHHDAPLAGHPGCAKTIQLIAWDYSWPGVSQDVQCYVCSCDLCQRNKATQHAPYGDLNPLEIPTRNWESISMDFITDLPPSHAFDTLLVVVDRLSKQSHFIPMIQSLDAPGLTQLYVSSIFKLHGLPLSIVSDQTPSLHPFFGMLWCHNLESNANFPQPIIHRQMVKPSKWTSVWNSIYATSVCISRMIG